MFVLFFHHCFYDFFQTKCEHFDSYLLFIEYGDDDWHKSSGFKVNKYARTEKCCQEVHSSISHRYPFGYLPL